MRSLYLGCGFMLAVLTAAPAAAGQCCGGHAAYDVAPVVAGEPVVPVSHYWFEPPGQVSQIYVVNQGPIYSGPGIYAHSNIYVPTLARPAAWTSHYANVHPYRQTVTVYPYVRGHSGYWPYRYAYRHYPVPVAPVIGLPSGGY